MTTSRQRPRTYLGYLSVINDRTCPRPRAFRRSRVRKSMIGGLRCRVNQSRPSFLPHLERIRHRRPINQERMKPPNPEPSSLNPTYSQALSPKVLKRNQACGIGCIWLGSTGIIEAGPLDRGGYPMPLRLRLSALRNAKSET